MVNKLGDMNGIPLYVDEYMEDGKVLQGRKGVPLGENQPQYLVANSKTANFMYENFKRKLRIEKLNRIMNEGIG